MWMKNLFAPQYLSFSFIVIFIGLSSFVQAQYKYQAPKGMVVIERDTVQIGSEKGRADEKPTFPFIIKPFLMDIKPVTVGDFIKFVRFTKYTTDAERMGESYVYNEEQKKWDTIPKAYWLYPFGRDSTRAKFEEPVIHMSWNDAKAYATWIGKRLPTEFEYELAAKKASTYKLKHINNALWHWCNDWYRFYNEEDYYTKRVNDRKSLRGGHFAHKATPYRPSQRLSALPYTATSMFGFRCAKDL